MTKLALITILVAVWALEPSRLLAAPTAAPNGAVVQKHRDRVGDRYSFVVDSTSQVTFAGRTFDTREHRTFELEVSKVSADGLTLRYLQLQAENLSPPDQGLVERGKISALNGIPVIFETSSQGRPVRLEDERGVRAALLDAVRRKYPAFALDVAAQLTTASSKDFLGGVGGENLAMMSDVQVRGPVVFGRQSDQNDKKANADGTAITIHRTTDVAPANDSCRVKVTREVLAERQGGPTVQSQFTQTRADVSAADGWVLDLDQTVTWHTGANEGIAKTSIRRTNPLVCSPS